MTKDLIKAANSILDISMNQLKEHGAYLPKAFLVTEDTIFVHPLGSSFEEVVDSRKKLEKLTAKTEPAGLIIVQQALAVDFSDPDDAEKGSNMEHRTTLVAICETKDAHFALLQYFERNHKKEIIEGERQVALDKDFDHPCSGLLRQPEEEQSIAA